MKLGGSGIVGIATGKNACPAGTAGARGQEHIFEFQTVFRQSVKIGCFDLAVPIHPDVVPTDVVRYDKNDIGSILRSCNPDASQNDQQDGNGLPNSPSHSGRLVFHVSFVSYCQDLLSIFFAARMS